MDDLDTDRAAEGALADEARAAFDAHEGPQVPPPPPPSGVVSKETFVRRVRSGEVVSVEEWLYQVERRKRERQRIADALKPGEVTTLAGVF